MKKKLLKVEKLRIFAMMCVLANHVSISALHIFDYSNILFGAFVSDFIHILARVGVPIFFIISGYLMLDVNYELSLNKLKKQIIKYIIIIAIYGSGFAWIELIFDTRTISIYQLPQALYCAFTGDTWNHMWFLYTYVGLLFALPVFKTFWTHEKEDVKNFVLVCGIILTSVLSRLDCGIAFQISSAYVFCFMFGGLLRDKERSNKFYTTEHQRILAAVLIINVMILAFLAYCDIYLKYTDVNSWTSDTSIFVLVSAFIIAVLFINKDNADIVNSNVTKLMSVSSFGVYIYHMFWINVIYKVVKINPFSQGLIFMIVSMVLIFAFVYMMSVVTTMITKKIPGLKKLI